VIFEGRVLAHPKIHNLYLDDDWDANNPDAPTRAQLDAFTQALVAGPYFDAAAQYGIGEATFTGSHGRSVFCIPVQPVLGRAEFVQILAWITCEVSFNPLSGPLFGILPAASGVPRADDDTLYVVYLPRAMIILDGDCSDFGAYHFFGAAPKFHTFLDVPTTPYSQTFAFAVIPTRCAPGSVADDIRDRITQLATHEIIEAATDPLVGTGWINNSVVDTSSTGGFFDFFKQVISELSDVALDLKVGEVADICSPGGSLTGPPYYQLPTPAVYLPVDDPSLANRILVSAYWSNGNANVASGCAPFLPSSTLTVGTPSSLGAARTFVTASTPLLLDATDGGTGFGVASVSYRAFPLGSAPPDYTAQAVPAQFSLSGPDGPYKVEFFATGNDGLVESPQSIIAVLDNTAPVIGIVVPATAQYAHSDTLILNYSVSDGAGSGVASTTPTMDGHSTVAGHGLATGQVINLLTELSVGPHTFTVAGIDNVANSGASSVTFTIIVTPDSIKQGVNQFLAAGLIKNSGLANSLLAKLNAAANARDKGNCLPAANNYQAFINELQAQLGTGVDTGAAQIMIADAQYLIAHCP
jgi:hypothetical protein